MAIYESARRHSVVRFPLTEKEYPLALMIAEGKLPVEVEGELRALCRRFTHLSRSWESTVTDYSHCGCNRNW